jgi:nucleoside-diphosphate-sugar epimerase
MKVLVYGGTGFIGYRVLRKLVERGHEVVAMDVNANLPPDADVTDRVQVIRGDITLMDDVVEAMLVTRPDRVLNLAYLLTAADPHFAVRLNVVGMDNCFEAARLCGVTRVTYASSLTVYGSQTFFGERPVVETDLRLGSGVYPASKVYNEHQAEWYSAAYGEMSIAGLRAAHVTGWDKVRGSVDHVRCITEPARGRPVQFPFRDAMRLPIHVEDAAEMFVRLTLADKPAHAVYNSGGYRMSLGELAELVRRFLPDADITFSQDSGGRDGSNIYLMDNTRFVEEFGYPLPPFAQRVLEMINEARRDEGLPPVPGMVGAVTQTR